MQKLPSRLKSNIPPLFRVVQKFFHLDTLNMMEKAGKFAFTSKLKLIKRSRIEVPLKLGHSCRGEAFSKKMRDPMYMAFCELKLDNEDSIADFTDLFLSFLKTNVNKSWSDFLPLSNQNAYGAFPSWTICLPWEQVAPKTKLKEYPKSLFDNRSCYHEAFSSSPTDSFQNLAFSKLVAESHAKQSFELLTSIKTLGWAPSSDVPTAYILKDDDNWRWMMAGQGNHRMYAMNVLNFNHVPIEVKMVVNKASVKNWYNVKNGVFTQSEALDIFDLIFHGKTLIKGLV